jgi:hypothetical protein
MDLGKCQSKSRKITLAVVAITIEGEGTEGERRRFSLCCRVAMTCRHSQAVRSRAPGCCHCQCHPARTESCGGNVAEATTIRDHFIAINVREKRPIATRFARHKATAKPSGTLHLADTRQISGILAWLKQLLFVSSETARVGSRGNHSYSPYLAASMSIDDQTNPQVGAMDAGTKSGTIHATATTGIDNPLHEFTSSVTGPPTTRHTVWILLTPSRCHTTTAPSSPP